MTTAALIHCPTCKGPLEQASELRCIPCDRTFHIHFGIPDFRDPQLDQTAAFDYEEDLARARALERAFPITTTFHELQCLFSALFELGKSGVHPDKVDVPALLKERGIRPKPASSADLAHGQFSLDKTRIYCEQSAKPMPKGIALEDGAGHGYFVAGLSQHFEHVVVLDFSYSYLILARRMMEEFNVNNATLICASAERLPIGDRSIDYVHSYNVIEHVADQSAVFKEAYRALKEGGMLFCVSPNRFSLYTEPHFRVPAFGFIPESIRRRLIQKRQGRSIDDIGLRSLSEIYKLATAHFQNVEVSFIPRRLKSTASGGFVRGAIVAAINSPIGAVVDVAVNKILLGAMPYHALRCWK
jgi:ubiquinone/menaquinone biosynthesis C-methylase UbiE/uncharacterized protein YbaR (Trm112 family)